ncbi:hypothetical protein [Streptomyces sp. TS71-3]|uniref:hypothetical protein n=1 Tax=Streptomyces sp. TS71-3 TaxID=2733862 RepID=UPI001B11A3B1|nr:hypothetical protein [Streptomyces sp. TS71-3]GHJ42172.1 hypothetical protein Sm713_77810 [Streptomyces sp. TS71-3]
MADTTSEPASEGLRTDPVQRRLFAGVYGTVLTSAMASALGNDSSPPDPGYDALWVLFTVLAAAGAHGFAHTIAQRTSQGRTAPVGTLHSVLEEWPLVAVALPTVAALAGAYAGWWSEDAGVAASLGINTAALFGCGLWSARLAGRGWFAACRAGLADMLLGLLIVVGNALIK